jgi:hypothetical protein
MATVQNSEIMADVMLQNLYFTKLYRKISNSNK